MEPRLRKLHRCPPHTPTRDVVEDELAYRTLKEFKDSAALLPETDGYSRSIYTPELQMADVMKADFDESNMHLPRDYENLAASKVRQDLRGCNVHAFPAGKEHKSFDRVPYNGNTSAGFGYENADGSFKKKQDPGVHRDAKRRAAALLYGYRDASDREKYLRTKGPLDCGFFRTQLMERLTPKVRSIFGRQFHMILLEGLFAWPLLCWFMINESIFAVGLNLFEQSLLMRRFVRDDCFWLTGDWRSFDRTCLEAEIRLAFSILRECVVIDDPLTALAWELVVECFVRSRVALPDGYVWATRGLVPSGSYLTGLIDSVINACRIRYLQIKLTDSYQPMTLLGDDFLLLVRKAVTISQINSLFKSMACSLKPGLLCSTDFDDLKFLGHQISGGIVYRHELEVLRLAVHPELPRTPLATRQALMALFTDSGCRYYYLYLAANLLRLRDRGDAAELVFDDTLKLFDRY